MNRQWRLLILSVGLLSACLMLPAGLSPLQELRIENAGSVDIKDLRVLFPGTSFDAPATRVAFGDVPAGGVTGYRSVPSGVYRYAAYEYSGALGVVQQPVIDWLGETPMQGRRFTYRLERVPSRPPGGQIELIEVVVDNP